MSGLARMAAQRGAVVTGSDRAASDVTQALSALGIAVTVPQSAHAVPDAVDLIVVSAAIPIDHPERIEARRRGVEVVKYAAMLGQLMRQPGTMGVAVAGTHGKSTTTSILCHVLMQAGLDPSFIVGAHCDQIGGGARVGQGNLLVAEACEFDRSFHHLAPTRAVILNVEADHLDMYGSLAEIVEAFAVFARSLPGRDAAMPGRLLIQHESPHRMAITAATQAEIETIGFDPQADWRVEAMQTGGWTRVDGKMATGRGVKLSHRGALVATWASPLPGVHMDYNAAVAAVLAHDAGADWAAIGAAIEAFTGLDRRMQRLGEATTDTGPALVIDDYGHHPTEIDATLRALRRHYQPQRLICVFQPHQHSRTRFLMEQFAVSFTAADRVLVPDIYFVRDSAQERDAVTAWDLVARLEAHGVDALHLDPLDTLVDHLRADLRGGDLVVTMGAGDVWKVGRALLM